MPDFTFINFTQLGSPGGGGAPNIGGAQTNPLSGSQILGSNPLSDTPDTSPGANGAGDIFNLLVGQDNTLPQQENFTPLGKNLPVQQKDESKAADNNKPKDSTLDALQAALASLAVQQSAPAPIQQPDTIASQQSDDVLAGNIQPAQQNLPQLPVQPVVDNADAASTDTQTPVAVQDNNTSAQNPVDQLLQNKTLQAYRSADALNKPEAGATLDTNDVNARDAVALLLAQKNTANATAATTAATDATSVAQDNGTNTQQLIQSLIRQNASNNNANQQAQADVVKTGAASDGKSASQLANLQATLSANKPDAPKPQPKPEQSSAQNADNGDSNNNNAAVANNVTAQAVAQPQQQNLSQQFGQKKPQPQTEQADAIKSVGDKPATADNLQLAQPVVHKPDIAPAQNFSNHLDKTNGASSPAEQIAMKISQLPSGKQSITVQLEPANLGKVDVKLDWNAADGKTNISISAEHKSTLDMLKSDMGTLQRSLADSGIKADASNLQFNLRGQDGFAGQFAQQNQQRSGNNNVASQSSSLDDDVKQVVESASIAARYVNLNNLVDLHV